MISNKLGLKWPETTHVWEKDLVRKVNFLNLIGSFNIVASLIVFNLIGFQSLNIHFFIALGLAAGVVLLSYRGKFILGSYLFFGIGVYLLGVAALYMQLESNVMMYFFPLTLSIVQIYGRKELFGHLIAWSVVYFLTIGFLVVFGSDYYPTTVDPELMATLKVFNGLFAYFCGLMQIMVITWLNIKQEEQIKQVIQEKRLLLAELYHRVKNNLNIVTSLINIKKNNSNSQEVIDALEDCRGRVYSMALVHQQMYSGSKVGNLNMMDYLVELIRNVEHAFGGDADVVLEVDSNELILPISKAVPIGLIMNELITNSYKHAVVPEQKLIVTIHVSLRGNSLQIDVSDNGPGIKPDRENSHSTLGFELIRSLCEQIDASFIIGKNTVKTSGANFQIKIIDYSVNTHLHV
ncbi:MAG: signal transduction histidine kinase [Fluviicola sp.]|uniref:sensor histidine kinase n=1 Tax=Fluviicola sp. TaxID=1917219 RepID=UPI00261D7A08|nr:sensor histidine kinase [Fluviicola sp.]MDF3029042.1 signal transduction histidine kinase [Fluviicola sp.]